MAAGDVQDVPRDARGSRGRRLRSSPRKLGRRVAGDYRGRLEWAFPQAAPTPHRSGRRRTPNPCSRTSAGKAAERFRPGLPARPDRPDPREAEAVAGRFDRRTRRGADRSRHAHPNPRGSSVHGAPREGADQTRNQSAAERSGALGPTSFVSARQGSTRNDRLPCIDGRGRGAPKPYRRAEALRPGAATCGSGRKRRLSQPTPVESTPEPLPGRRRNTRVARKASPEHWRDVRTLRAFAWTGCSKMSPTAVDGEIDAGDVGRVIGR